MLNLKKHWDSYYIQKMSLLKMEIVLFLRFQEIYWVSALKKEVFTESTVDSFDDALRVKYLRFLSSINLKEYTGEILDYIAGYIVKNMCQKLVCTLCIDILTNSQTDHNYLKNINFTSFVNRRKLKIVSPTVSLIMRELEK